ncbi:hypothetical protein GCM10008983_05510 [Lentibacillus halophilus]|uniref:Uncharacterized protein n=1 Tax=Lentibacillus halophilus TaxID=295065 RepID=A0ABP3IXG9_9BACI
MDQQLMEQIFSELKEIKQTQENTNDRLTAFEQNTNERFTSLDNRLTEFEQNTNERFTASENRMTEFEQSANERFSNIESKLQIVYEQTGKLTEYHEQTMAALERVATKDDLTYFDKKIGEHDREISKLKERV